MRPHLVLFLLAVMATTMPIAALSAPVYEYGDTLLSHLGWSVAAVGDLNGDGLPDFVAGEPSEIPGLGNGRVRVYFGGSPGGPGLVLGAGLPIEGFGFSVAGGGDFNGDGYPDLIVGALWRDWQTTGAAYVYFGGPTMDNVPDVVLSPPAGAVNFGYRVAFIGDRNGDHFADVAVSAPGWYGQPSAPHVYVYHGRAIPELNPDEVLDAPGSNLTFGASLSPAGDVNHDGYDDFLVSELSSDLRTSPPQPVTGSVYLYLGGAASGTAPDRTFTGTPGEMFGCSIAGAVDLNGDGFDDIVIGSPDNNPPGVPYAGMIQVFYGGANMDTQPDVTRFGRSYASGLGISMASGSDVNGDGVPDLAVGAISEPQEGVAIYFGGAALHNAPDRWIASPFPASWGFGYSVALPGDLNGDGMAEVVTGISDQSSNYWRQGAVAIESGQSIVAVPDLPHAFTFLAPAPNPARDAVHLSLTLDHADHLSVDVYDVSGRIVARPIENEMLGPGPVSRAWSLGELPTGIYWVRARFANRNAVQRLVHLQGP